MLRLRDEDDGTEEGVPVSGAAAVALTLRGVTGVPPRQLSARLPLLLPLLLLLVSLDFGNRPSCVRAGVILRLLVV